MTEELLIIFQFSNCHPHASRDTCASVESGLFNKLSGEALSKGNSIEGDISAESLTVVSLCPLVPSIKVPVDWGIIEYRICDIKRVIERFVHDVELHCWVTARAV